MTFFKQQCSVAVLILALLSEGAAAVGAGGEASAAEETRKLEVMRREMEQLIRRQGKAETDSERQQISQELADLLEKWRKAALHLKPRTLYETPVRMDSRFESYGRAILEGLEAYGTENFPKKEGKSIYGKAIVNIVILPTGRLEAAEIVKSSGIKELDQHALQAIRRLTPLPPFNKELRRDVDRVVFTLPFEYTKTDPKP